MKTLKNRKHFTLLELLIAVIIFMIVSVVITAVYKTTLDAYRRGNQYSDISQSLSGTFIVMENDLNKLVTVNDKDSVFFKENEFSFIAVNKNKDNHSYLQQIKYSFDADKLLRYSVKYPDDKINIDRDPVLFLENLDEPIFKYIYKKEKKKKSAKNQDANKQGNNINSEDDQENNSNQNNNSDNISTDKNSANGDKSKISKDTESDSNIKIPLGITISGTIQNKDLKQEFKTTLMVPLFTIQKMPKPKDKKDDKNKKDNTNNQNNDSNNNQNDNN